MNVRHKNHKTQVVIVAALAFGNDELHGGKSRDIIKGGPGLDKLFGEGSNDKLYGGTGDDDLKGGAGADHFDCGKGNDEILDFNPSQGDTKTKNCEDF